VWNSFTIQLGNWVSATVEDFSIRVSRRRRRIPQHQFEQSARTAEGGWSLTAVSYQFVRNWLEMLDGAEASAPKPAVRTENLTANVLMMQSAQNRNRHDIADRLPASEQWCVFAQR
jgi:hypothetical protein